LGAGTLRAKTTEALDEALPNTRVVTYDGHGHAAMLTAPNRFVDEVRTVVREVDDS
jgi:pimeloyl-ACP methyl ester carboxylesterase